MVEQCLRRLPAVGALRIKESGKNVLPIGLDDPGVGWIRCLAFARYAADFVSLDHHHRIFEWCPHRYRQLTCHLR